ncbi:MAG: hypothetical protein IPL46_02220 [Saprospiraceae bacterium]|nr:hypothetical protein [Saprospiraceae bacterium]
MKNSILILFLIGLGSFKTEGQNTPQYKIITVVESIVPGGLGRSRILENHSEVDIEELTTARTDGKTSSQKDVKRSDAKIDELDESKLLNFYSVAGINFQNIASNDAIITSKLSKLAGEGWQIAFVTSSAESDCGETDGQGIYITRFILRK